ncbi:hypothetical protein NLJ89_g2232 [Agrocybe chaxingu]|uniref:Uncharacterized protein n=1 Tax=Agrocybe chaxingu TaxID=84603 RepID=A0A9W8K703_9AGAR|nr:hypothetical protein NLJ89_g2232 [Agrocybe chaxingu]
MRPSRKPMMSRKSMMSRFNTFWSSSVSDSKATTFSKPETSIQSSTALKTLQAIGNLSQSKTLRDAATEATAVLETLITTKHIDRDFQRLGQEICRLIIVIATEYEETPASQDLQVSIGEIGRHIASLKTLCHKYSNCPRWKTFIRQQYDRRGVTELRSGVAGIAHRVSGLNKFEALNTLELWNENAATMKHLEELMAWLQKNERKNNEQPLAQNLSLSDEQSKDQPETPSSSTAASVILRQSGEKVRASPASDVPETPYPALESAGGECNTVAPPTNPDSTKLELENPKTNVPPLVPITSLISPESGEPEVYVDRAFSDTVIHNSSVISNSYNNNGCNAGAENQPIITQTWKDSTFIDSQVVSNSGSGNDFSHLLDPTMDIDFSASAAPSMPMWYPYPMAYLYPVAQVMYPQYQPPNFSNRRRLKVHTVRHNPTRARRPRFSSG